MATSVSAPWQSIRTARADAREWRVLSLCLLAICWPTGQLRAQADKKRAEPETASYYKDVRPVLVQNCQGCHQPAKAMGEFVLTSLPGPPFP